MSRCSLQQWPQTSGLGHFILPFNNHWQGLFIIIIIFLNQLGEYKIKAVVFTPVSVGFKLDSLLALAG